MRRTGNRLDDLQEEIDALQAQINRFLKRAIHWNMRIHKLEQWVTEHIEDHPQEIVVCE